MKKDFDFSWFDLKKYDGLKEYKLYGWYIEISRRRGAWFYMMDAQPMDINDKKRMEQHARVLSTIEELKNNPIMKAGSIDQDFKYRDEHRYGIEDSEYPFNTDTVASTTALDMRLMATDKILDDVWEYCDRLNDADFEIPHAVYSPFDFLYIRRKYNLKKIESLGLEDNFDQKLAELDLCTKDDECFGNTELEGLFANITVNLAANDDQIREDFKHWLAKYREAINYNPYLAYLKQPFGNTHFIKWTNQRLLPYIDLKLAAKAEKYDLGDDEIERLVWRGLKVKDKVDRTTEKNADKLMNIKTSFSMKAQLGDRP